MSPGVVQQKENNQLVVKCLHDRGVLGTTTGKKKCGEREREREREDSCNTLILFPLNWNPLRIINDYGVREASEMPGPF